MNSWLPILLFSFPFILLKDYTPLNTFEYEVDQVVFVYPRTYMREYYTNNAAIFICIIDFGSDLKCIF